MTDAKKFRHDRSLYERPSLPYRCGRTSVWSRPCWQGPGLDGKCGGEAQCEPVRKGDRWECRRPPRAGGPCRNGPMPDGQCAKVRPPCMPHATIRQWRGRISLFSMALMGVLIAAFANFSAAPSASVASIDPGPLSSIHAGFTQEQGCGACHAAHDLKGISWFTSAFLPQDNAGQCVQCHGFAGGRERSPHNAAFAHRPDIGDIQCAACHTEHKGADFDPAAVASSTCANCHEPKFTSFGANHPGFAASFPYQVPNSIHFDHAKHLKEYFTDARWTKASNRDGEFAERARVSCVVCHEVEAATREVRPRGYEEVCARCHDHQITQRELVLYAPEELMPLAGLVLGIGEDAEDADEQLAEALEQMSERSVDVLAEGLERLDAADRAQVLLRGLSAVLVQRAASVWLQEEEYEPDVIAELEVKGWNAGEDELGGQSLHYQPSGHADVLVRAWVDFGVQVRQAAADDETSAIADAALAHLVDPQEGPGGCGKCHAAGVASPLESEQAGEPQWTYRGSVERPYTAYAHAPHINLLGPDVSCKRCHTLNLDADYSAYFEDQGRAADDFVSNFVSIGRQTCERCHRAGIVRFDCQLCHTYHREPSFKASFQERRVR